MNETIILGNILGDGKPLEIAADKLIMGRTFITSITRYGKSWLCRRIVEQLVGKAGIVIIDPEGEYASLREKFPFLIIGKDIPVQVETAEFIAETVLTEDLSVIIDLSLVDDDLGKEFVAKFVSRFMFLETKLRKPYLFVVEEADEFAPERGISKAISVKAFRNLAKKGGKRGVGLIVVTHRSAWVTKGVLSQCTSLKLIGRVEWNSDLDVLQDFLQIHPNILRRPKKNGEPFDDGRPHIDCLSPGQFFVSGSLVDSVAFVKIGKVQTTHLGCTPDIIPPTPRELKGVVEKLAEMLPKILEEKLKPEAARIVEIEEKAERKYKEKFEQKFAKDKKKLKAKLEAEYSSKFSELRDKNKGLEEQIEQIGRTQSLEPFSPLASVFDHPIVKARMTKLEQREIDLLRKIELQPNLTREQLAAFLNASRDSVKNIINKINRIFRAEVIIGMGRPIRYRSALKRCFLTDAAKREISELQRLQDEIKSLREERTRINDLRRSQASTIEGLKLELRNLPSYDEHQKRLIELGDLREALKKSELERNKTNKKLRRLNKRIKKIRELSVVDPNDEIPTEPEKTHEESPPLIEKVRAHEESTSDLNRQPQKIRDAIVFLSKHQDSSFSKLELEISLGVSTEKEAFFDALKAESSIEYIVESNSYRYKEVE